jgi:hypothetical protein
MSSSGFGRRSTGIFFLGYDALSLIICAVLLFVPPQRAAANVSDFCSCDDASCSSSTAYIMRSVPFLSSALQCFVAPALAKYKYIYESSLISNKPCVITVSGGKGGGGRHTRTQRNTNKKKHKPKPKPNQNQNQDPKPRLMRPDAAEFVVPSQSLAL